MADRQALFKAAKAQRGSAALNKEQIKALKAQKLKAAAEAEAQAREAEESRRKHEAALAAASRAASQRSNGVASTNGNAMLPPAPRPRASTASVGSAPGHVAHRTDSQLTAVGRNGSIAPEPAGQSNASSGVVHDYLLRQQSIDGEQAGSSLPANFFDQPAASGPQESVGTGEMAGSNADVHSEVASALARGDSVDAASSHTTLPGLPADFFEAAGSSEGAEAAAGAGQAAQQPRSDQPATGALPKGFFANKDDDARARGVAPARKKSKEEEYADFMTAIAAEVKDAEAGEEQEAERLAQDRTDREAFEQRVRQQRIERLRQGQKDLPDPGVLLQSEAVKPRVEPVVSQSSQRKRKLEADDESSGESEEEEELDWRAKAF